MERIRFLERQRGVLLYFVGMQQVQNARAREEEVRRGYTFSQKISNYRWVVYHHGQAAAHYDAASRCFERAARTLAGLGDLPLDDPVVVCSEAHRKAEHLGRGHVHLANYFMEETATVEGEGTATPTEAGAGGMETANPDTPTDDGGMEMADPDTPTEDRGMSLMQPHEEFHHPGVDDPRELASDHFGEADTLAFENIGTLQAQLGLGEG